MTCNTVISQWKGYAYSLSSLNFQVCVFEDKIDGSLASDDTIKALKAWWKDTEAAEFISAEGHVGGYYDFPSLPDTLKDFQRHYPEDKPIKVC